MLFSDFSLEHDAAGFIFLSFCIPPVFTSETCWSMPRLLSCPRFPSSAQMMGLAANSCCGHSTPQAANKDIPLNECFELSEIAQAEDISLGPSMLLKYARNTGDFFCYWYLGDTSSPDPRSLVWLVHLLQRCAELFFKYLQAGLW